MTSGWSGRLVLVQGLTCKGVLGRAIVLVLIACAALFVFSARALAATGEITGAVTDASSPTHAPVEDADVTIYDSSGDVVTSTCTGADGTYTASGLATGSYRVGFVTGGPAGAPCGVTLNYLEQWYSGGSSLDTATDVAVTDGSATSGIDASLDPGGQISGTLTDASSQAAVGNVEVDLYDARGHDIASACSDGSGAYTLAGLPAGDYYVGFDPSAASGYCGTALNYLPQFFNGKASLASADPVSVALGSTVVADAALQPGGEISGTVTDAASHAALSGVDVDVYDSSGNVVTSACTAADGTYTALGLSTHSYRVSFNVAATSGPFCGGGANYLPQYFNGKSSFSSADSVAVTAGSTTSGVDASMHRAGKITGEVTDAASLNPLQGVEVDVYDSSGNLLNFSCTGADGSYTLSYLPPGSYRVGFAAMTGGTCGITRDYLPQYYSGRSSLASADLVTVTDAGTTSGIDAALQPAGQISGTVRDASSQAGIRGVEVDLYDASGNFVTSVCTAPDGTYTVPGLIDGTYHVGFRASGGSVNACGVSLNYLPQYYDGQGSLVSASPVTVTGSMTTSGIDAALQASGQVSGTVTDALTQAPIQNVRVTVVDATTGQGGSAYTDASGNYTVTGLPSGSYTVTGLPSGSYTAEFDDQGLYIHQFYNGASSAASATDVAVNAPSTTFGINASLQPAGRISGTVTDAVSQAGLGGIAVDFYDASGNVVVSTCTESNGTYSVPGFAAGSYKVAFAHSSCGARPNYLPQYYKGESSLTSADSVSVTAGANTQGVDAALEPAGQISGVVTDAKTHAAIQNVQVDVYDPGDAKIVGATCTAGDGTYTVADLAPGSYRVGFSGVTGGCGALPLNYQPQYYDHASSLDAGTPVTVAAGGTTANINAAMDSGARITGAVTDAASHAGIANILVDVYDGSGNAVAGVETTTDSTGSYLIAGLPAGSYKVGFSDPRGTYASQFYNGQSSLAAANVLSLAAGSATPHVDGTLTPAAHTLSTSTTGTGSGTITSMPGGINCGEICSTTFPASTQVTLTATPAPGSTFAGWAGNACSGTGPCVVTMGSVHAVSAVFVAATSGSGGDGGSGGSGGGGSAGWGQPGGSGQWSASGNPVMRAGAPFCSIGIPSSRVTVRKAKRRRSVDPGRLIAKITCNQTAVLTLAGKLTVVGKRATHGKAKTTVSALRPVRGTTKPGQTTVLAVKLPLWALTERSKGASESASLKLGASNANGSNHFSRTVHLHRV